MAKFIRPYLSWTEIKYLPSGHTNKVVNIDMCLSIEKFMHFNGYGDRHPSIQFKFPNYSVSWIFPKGHEKRREDQFNEIIETNSSVL